MKNPIKEDASYSNYKQEQNNELSLKKGKIPPQAIELEEAILGAMMIDKKGLDEVIDVLAPEVFYKAAHQEIFKVIQLLFHNSEPIDLYTVATKLKQRAKLEKIGGEYFLVMLTQKVVSSIHIEYHSRIIQQKFILRKLIETSFYLEQKAYDPTVDVFELLDSAESKLFEISHHQLKRSFQSAESLVSQAISRIKKVEQTKGISGIPSGFSKLDKITSGWQNADLIILAARPGMGKTAFVLSMARNMAVEKEIPVAIFSLEMSSVQLITRLISSETGISSEKLRKAQLSSEDWNRLNGKIRKLENAPIFIDDTPSLSIFDLRAKARRLVSQQKIKMIMVDYLQLMTIGNPSKMGNREQEISIISRSLKSIAKELDIPVVALSQLSRAVETRGGTKRPMLSDLRESGAIEQDADIVSFIYRPEYYGFTTWDSEDNLPCLGEAELIIAKHRNGSLENVRLKFISNQAKFIDLPQENISSFTQINESYSVESKINDKNSAQSINAFSSKNPFEAFDLEKKQGRENFLNKEDSEKSQENEEEYPF